MNLLKNRFKCIVALLLLSCLQLMASESNKLYIPDLIAFKEKTMSLPVYMNNTAEITAVQFTLETPFKFLSLGTGVLTDRKDDHQIVVKEMSDRNYMVMIYSPQNTMIKGNSGQLMFLDVTIPSTVIEGESYNMILKDVILSAKDGTNVVTEYSTGAISIAKSPDLTVSDVKVDKNSYVPGESMAVSWNVKNIGARTTDGGWKEQIYLQNADNSKLLGTIYHDSKLGAGASVSGQASIVLPEIIGIDGQTSVMVKLVPNADAGERPESLGNNMANSSTITVARRLILSVPDYAVDENTVAVRCKLSRSGNVANAETYTITNHNNSRITLPTKVTIEKNQSGVVFYANLIDNDLLDADSIAKITVKGDFYPEIADTIIIEDNELAELELSLDADSVVEGGQVALTIKTNRVTNTPVVVNLTSDSEDHFSFPENIVIPAGESSVTVNISTIDDSTPNLTIDATVVASAAKHKNGYGDLLIGDNDIPDIELDFSVDKISESNGIYAISATLRRTNLTNSKIIVELSDDSNGRIYYSTKKIELASGVQEATFNLGAIDNALVDGDQEVTVVAAVYISSCNCSTTGTSKGVVARKVTILDNDGASLALKASTTAAIEGKELTLTVSRNTSTDADLAVTITSDSDDMLAYEKNVIIPAGKSSVDVVVNVLSNDVSGDSKTIMFTAESDGYTNGLCYMMLTDQTLPDAEIVKISVDSTEIELGKSVALSIDITNTGAIAMADCPVAVFVNGASSPTKTFYVNKAIEVGETVTVTKKLDFTENIGTYSIKAQVNYNKPVTELTYNNNHSEVVKVKVLPNFSATVTTDKTVYKQGETVTINGVVTGSAVANANVEVYLINNSARQTLSATADADGKFTITYTPYALQSGHFVVGACFPGENSYAEQAAFDVYGLKRASNDYISHDITVGEQIKGSIGLNNPGQLDLTGVNVELLSVPENYTITFDQLSNITGGQTVNLGYTLIGNSESAGTDWELIKARITTAEGVTLDLTLYCYCRVAKGKLLVSETSINTTMAKGHTREYPITINNVGKGSTGKITVSIPEWMKTVTPVEMSALETGESATIILSLTPTEDMILNMARTGNIGINCENGDGVSVSYNIITVSETTGTLVVDVCDEYTYNTTEAPHVSGAGVVIKHPTTNAIVAQGTTDENGLYTIELPEGYYNISVTESNHDSYNNTILIDPGKDNNHEVFISFNAITYSWDVVETEVEDEYEIETTVKYETNVPAPVIVVDFPENLLDKTQIANVVVTNKGLLSAYDIGLSISTTDPENYRIEVLGEYPIAEIRPQESIVIPLMVTVNTSQTYNVKANDISGKSFINRLTAKSTNEEKCVCSIAYFFYEVKECVDGNWIDVLKSFKWVKCEGDCGSNVKLPQIIIKPGEGQPTKPIKPINPPSPPNAPITVPDDEDVQDIPYIKPIIIDGCVTECVKGLLDAAKGCLDAANGCLNPADKLDLLGCAKDVIPPCYEAIKKKSISKGIDCILGGAGCVPGPIGCAAGIIGCIKGLGEGIYTCVKNLDKDKVSTKSVTTKSKGFTSISDPVMADYLMLAANQLELLYTNYNLIFGDSLWFDVKGESIYKVANYIHNNTDNVGYILLSEDRYGYKPENISNEQFDLFINRINNTTSFVSGVEISGNNFIDIDELIFTQSLMMENEEKAVEYGFADFNEMCDTINSYYKYLLDNADEYTSNSVCASITLQFEQSMVMTRQAFRGTLTVFNGHEALPMTNVKLNLEVRDEDGNLATSREMEINAETLDAFAGELSLTSGWSLEANKTGVATVLFIPSKYAAPTEAKDYSFGGTLTYLDPFTGYEVTRDLYPVTLTVKPSPNLDMTYFMQRDILGDDALTADVVEPSVPAEFALLINNVGYGDAENVVMTTKQPEIIENEKGLLIDFELLSSQLNGKEHTLALGGSVATEFGTIPAHSTAYAQWWLQSSLLGHFTEYDVKATHVTSYGNKDLSLLNNVTIHELIRSLRFGANEDDSKIGFLVNDIQDLKDLPDMLYKSDGSILPVAQSGTTLINKNNDTEYTLSVTANEAGWVYGSVLDPTLGNQEIVSVVRDSDGSTINVRNFWQTDRTLLDSREPLYEYRIHFADTIGAGSESYTIVFSPKPKVQLAVDSYSGVPVDLATSPVETVTVKFNKAIKPETFTHEDVSLSVQGVKQDVSVVSVEAINDREFNLNLSQLAAGDGYYVLTVHTSGIEDAEGFAGKNGKTASWVMFHSGKVQLAVNTQPVGAGLVTVLQPGAERPDSVVSGGYTLDYEKSVALSVIANEGYKFLSWTVDGESVGTEKDLTRVLTGHETITANFEAIQYQVDIISEQGIVSGGNSAIYKYGTAITLTVEPIDGYEFVCWSVDGEEVYDKTLMVTIKSDMTIVANCSKIATTRLKYNLAKGWNWMSVNVGCKDLNNLPALLSPLGTMALAFESKDEELLYNYNWSGSLSSVTTTSMYRLKTRESKQSLNIEGVPVDPSSSTITINPGWNWIGYTPTEELSLDAALSSLAISEGDIIKSQSVFAVYDGTVWVGNLKTLKPGLGYQYYSDVTKSFNYAASQNDVVSEISIDLGNEEMSNSRWSCDLHQYPDNMATLAKIENADGGQYEIGVFVDGVCRGISTQVDSLYHIMIYGDEPVELSFKILDVINDIEYKAVENYNFNSGAIGTISSPMLLNIDENSGIYGVNTDNVMLYPNPAKELIYIKGIKDVKTLTITDSRGTQHIRMHNPEISSGVNVSTIPVGVYIMTIETDTQVIHKRFVRMGNQ
ncbi:MAG: T9SS type A sorting domain-containing protein [Bacteroidales bacterium]|nr:T9SS type A sorting domain-containing protein [Bacteroidales bacterium]